MAPIARLRHAAGRFAPDAKAMALVEFAMVLPVMVLLWVGGIATTQGVMTDRKVTLLSRSIGDMVAQSTKVSTTDLNTIFSAAAAILTPFSAGSSILTMRVNSVAVDSTGKSCVVWSVAANGAVVRPANSTMDSVIPAGVRTPGTYLIVPEVTYLYTPIVGADVTGAITLKELFFMGPRKSTSVTWTDQTYTSTCTTS